jgi:hypothetical protein
MKSPNSTGHGQTGWSCAPKQYYKCEALNSSNRLKKKWGIVHQNVRATRSKIRNQQLEIPPLCFPGLSLMKKPVDCDDPVDRLLPSKKKGRPARATRKKPVPFEENLSRSASRAEKAARF